MRAFFGEKPEKRFTNFGSQDVWRRRAAVGLEHDRFKGLSANGGAPQGRCWNEQTLKTTKRQEEKGPGSARLGTPRLPTLSAPVSAMTPFSPLHPAIDWLQFTFTDLFSALQAFERTFRIKNGVWEPKAQSQQSDKVSGAQTQARQVNFVTLSTLQHFGSISKVENSVVHILESRAIPQALQGLRVPQFALILSSLGPYPVLSLFLSSHEPVNMIGINISAVDGALYKKLNDRLVDVVEAVKTLGSRKKGVGRGKGKEKAVVRNLDSDEKDPGFPESVGTS
ncbi:hypothetical protein B0H11DRAFT_1908455 [Mycena galericulata]|nr:hypothetical protein B0H11DRAFT_1908455 [Mycena galericulata]